MGMVGSQGPRYQLEEKINLQPLSTAAIQEYLGYLLGGKVSDARATTVHRKSGGIPFYSEAITGPLIEAGEFHQAQSGKLRYYAQFLVEADAYSAARLAKQTRDRAAKIGLHLPP